MLNLCQAPLSMDTIADLIKTTNELLSTHNHYIVKDVIQMLNVVDHLIKSFYSTKVQLEHRADKFDTDIGYQDFLSIMYKQFHDLIDLGDKVFKESAPYQTYLVDASTHTFQLTDHISTSETFKGNEGITVLSPNLLGQSELLAPVGVYIRNEHLENNHSNITRMIVWSYSRHLFPPDKKYASHVVSLYPMQVVRDKADFNIPTFKDTDYVYIRFPLKVMPPELDLEKVLKCVALHYAEDDHVAGEYYGKVLSSGNFEEDDRPYVVCSYSKMLAGYYFSVVFGKDEIPHMHTIKTAKALTTDDNFHLQVLLEDKPNHSASLILSLQVLLMGASALVMNL